VVAGAVVDGPEPHVVRNDDVIDLAGVSEVEFAAIRDRELLEKPPALGCRAQCWCHGIGAGRP
jgi:hypothetical protein